MNLWYIKRMNDYKLQLKQMSAARNTDRFNSMRVRTWNKRIDEIQSLLDSELISLNILVIPKHAAKYIEVIDLTHDALAGCLIYTLKNVSDKYLELTATSGIVIGILPGNEQRVAVDVGTDGYGPLHINM